MTLMVKNPTLGLKIYDLRNTIYEAFWLSFLLDSLSEILKYLNIEHRTSNNEC